MSPDQLLHFARLLGPHELNHFPVILERNLRHTFEAEDDDPVTVDIVAEVVDDAVELFAFGCPVKDIMKLRIETDEFIRREYRKGWSL